MNFAEVIGVLRKEVMNYHNMGYVTNLSMVLSDLLVGVPVIQMMDGCQDAGYYLAIRPCGFELAPTQRRLEDRLAILGPALACYRITWTNDLFYSIDKYSM